MKHHKDEMIYYCGFRTYSQQLPKEYIKIALSPECDKVLDLIRFSDNLIPVFKCLKVLLAMKAMEFTPTPPPKKEIM